MVDITHKSSTLRVAIAEAMVAVSPVSLEAIQAGTVPKGDVFEMSKAAGLLGVKKTPELLPDCHPLPIEYTGFEFSLEEAAIRIRCTVKTIYKTGVEVEAMHGASIAALNMYDMLKPLDKDIEIQTIRLVKKTGGKSGRPSVSGGRSAAVLVCSDSIAAGQGEDRAGKALVAMLEGQDLTIDHYEVIPDEANLIQERVRSLQKQGTDLLLVTGGTGVGPRDQTPEALGALMERRLPGVEEAMRAYGQQRTPVAMFSRSLAGIIGNSIALALPGSTGGATDSLQAVFPTILHLFDVLKGAKHS